MGSAKISKKNERLRKINSTESESRSISGPVPPPPPSKKCCSDAGGVLTEPSEPLGCFDILIFDPCMTVSLGREWALRLWRGHTRATYRGELNSIRVIDQCLDRNDVTCSRARIESRRRRKFRLAFISGSFFLTYYLRASIATGRFSIECVIG